MRHRVQKKKLNRKTSHRVALLKNLSDALILHGKVETTVAKAKFFKPYVEKLVTKAKKDSTFTTVQRVRAKLATKAAARKLFDDIAPTYKTRNGGYTRIKKLGFRDGDNAPMALIEWVKDEKKASPKKVAKASSKAEAKKETKKSEKKPAKKVAKKPAKKAKKDKDE